MQGETGIIVVLGVKGDSGVVGGEEEEKHELEEEPPPSYESDNMLSNSELKDDEDVSLRSKSSIGVRGRGRAREGFESPRRISFL